MLLTRNLNVCLTFKIHCILTFKKKGSKCLLLCLSGYVAVVGFITFAVCYRYGPLVDAKSINILSWTLQLLGLLLIYLGIQIQQVAFSIIVAAVFSKNLEYPVSLTVAACRWVCTEPTEGGVRAQYTKKTCAI